MNVIAFSAPTRSAAQSVFSLDRGFHPGGFSIERNRTALDRVDNNHSPHWPKHVTGPGARVGATVVISATSTINEVSFGSHVAVLGERSGKPELGAHRTVAEPGDGRDAIAPRA